MPSTRECGTWTDSFTPSCYNFPTGKVPYGCDLELLQRHVTSYSSRQRVCVHTQGTGVVTADDPTSHRKPWLGNHSFLLPVLAKPTPLSSRPGLGGLQMEDPDWACEARDMKDVLSLNLR